MSYVVAAYAVSLGSVVLYALHLSRERHRLCRDLEGRTAPGASASATSPGP